MSEPVVRRRAALAAIAALLLSVPTIVAVAGDEPERKVDAVHVKVGQRYTFKLIAKNLAVWEVTGKTDDEITYRIHLTVAGKELSAGEPQRFLLKPKGKKETPKKVGDETLEVSGIKFACAIYETETGGQTVRTWKANAFPEAIKTEMGKDVTRELVEIK